MTLAFGIVGAAVAWSARCTIDALAIFWASGMLKRSVSSALLPAAALAASFIVSRIIGPGFFTALAAAVVVGLVLVILAYAYSEDSAEALIQATAIRARKRLDNLSRGVFPKPSVKPTADP